MSPKEKHIPDDAQRTTVSLTAEDRAALFWIKTIRQAKKDKRTTNNDILVDALWYFMEKAEGKTKDQIRALVPSVSAGELIQSNITEMPKPKSKR
jgi:hypothetical protein